MTMPRQKPHRSKQDYATPENFIVAVKSLSYITNFAFDFAADSHNTKAGRRHWNEWDDSLSKSGEEWATKCNFGWGWLNPPFAKIGPWAAKCADCKEAGGHIALLVPAAVGSNWFRDYVGGRAYVLFLNGRLAFDPAHPSWGYPKDCMLCLYSADITPGYTIWDWSKEL